MVYIPSDMECPLQPLIKPGIYTVEVIVTRETDRNGMELKTKNEDKFWKICLVTRGNTESSGLIVWDQIIFSQNQKLMSRAKDILNKFGIDTSRGLNLENSDILLHREAIAEIYIDEYNGQKNNKVVFWGGYHKLEEKENKNDDDIPL